MSLRKLVDLSEKPCLKERASFDIGDTLDVHVRIVEGDKERIQIFTGIVIARKGTGTNSTFKVRRLVGSEGVERTFPLHSPFIDRLEVKKKGKVRRAKLYFLRDRVGKGTRLAERFGIKGTEESKGVAVKPRQAGSGGGETKSEPKKEEAKK